MKNFKIFGIAAALFGMVFTGCSDPDDIIIDRNFAYLANPSAIEGVAYEKVIKATDASVDLTYSVQLINYASEDVKVTLSVDNATLVADYNTEKNSDYTAIPQDKISFSGESVTVVDSKTIIVTVPSGKNNAVVNVNIQKFATMVVGEEYAVAAKITAVDGDANAIAPGVWATMLCPVALLSATADENDLPGIEIPVTPHPIFKYLKDDHNFTLQAKNWAAYFDGDFTVELWMNASAYGTGSLGNGSGGNAQLFDNRKLDGVMHKVDDGEGGQKSTDEFFVRFGNTISNYKSTLEVKAFGGSGSDDLTNLWPRQEWIHLAIVYKKRDNTIIAYRNGEVNQKLDGYPEPKFNGGKLLWQHIGMIGSHNTGIIANATMELREFRFWKSARRATQIKNYMRLRVDPAEPNLVAYYTFDDVSGSGITPTSFSSTAKWEGTADIPVPPALEVWSPTYFAGWGEPVNFKTVQVTLADGSKSPAGN